MVATWLASWFVRRPSTEPRLCSSPLAAKDVALSTSHISSASAPKDSDDRAEVQVITDQTPEGLVVRVQGVAGVKQAGALEAGLANSMLRRPALVTLDVGKLRSISALAMGVLMNYRRGLLRANGRVRLAYPLQPAVREALERADLLHLFEKASTVAPEESDGVGYSRRTEGAAVLATATH